MRIVPEVLDELIEHNGEIKHGPINTTGVLRLALDLREARARITELEQELAELGGIAEGISADLKRIKSKLTPAQPTEPDALQAYETHRKNRKHRKRATVT